MTPGKTKRVAAYVRQKESMRKQQQSSAKTNDDDVRDWRAPFGDGSGDFGMRAFNDGTFDAWQAQRN